MNLRRCSPIAVAILAALQAGACDGPKPAPVAPFQFGRPDVVLLVTASTDGRLEVCDCPEPVGGGLSRRSGLVASYRAAFDRTIVFDAGDAFWVDPADTRDEWVLRGYRLAGYDCLALGDQEWSVGPDRLSELRKTAGVEFLASNVVVLPAEAAVKPSPAAAVFRKQWGGLRVAVLSFVDDEPLAFVPPETRQRLRVEAAEAVQRQAADLKRQGFLVVLNVHGPMGLATTMAESSGADLVIRSHAAKSASDVRRAAGAPIVSVGGSETVSAVAMKVEAGRVKDLELRVEAVDVRWPEDKRVTRVFFDYARHAGQTPARSAEGG